MMTFMEAHAHAMQLREEANAHERDAAAGDAAYWAFVSAFELMVITPCESVREVAFKLQAILDDAEGSFRDGEIEAVLKDLFRLSGAAGVGAGRSVASAVIGSEHGRGF